MKLTLRQTEIIEAMREWPVDYLYFPYSTARVDSKYKIGKMIVDKYMLKRLKNMGILTIGNDNRIGRITYVLKAGEI